jgi:hypothetical protein
LPELFKERYQLEYSNLKQNLNKVVTPMDIHETLSDLIQFESNFTYLPIKNNKEYSKQRQISLFKSISDKRNCADAGIGSYYDLILR